MTMILKPQDIMVLLKIIAKGQQPWSYASLSTELFMSASEVHQGVKRAINANLFNSDRNSPIKRNLEHFLIHGIKYVFVPDRGEITRGILTAYAAPVFDGVFVHQKESLPPVWPSSEGPVKGYSFSPLYKSAPAAAQLDPILYEYLAIVDALRDGRSREQHTAAKFLTDRIRPGERS